VADPGPGEEPPLSDLRAEVLAFVRRYPGVHGREVDRQMGLPTGLADYHLRALEEQGQMLHLRADGYGRWFPRDEMSLDPEDVRLVCFLRRPPALRIVLLLMHQGEMTPADLSDLLGLARPSISYHLRALEKADLVAVRPEGRSRWYRLAHPERARRVVGGFHTLPGDLDRFSAIWDDLVRG